MRGTEEIHTLVEWMEKVYYARQHSVGARHYVAGVVDALRWVSGQRPRAPVTGRRANQPGSPEAIAQEAHAATQASNDGGESIGRPTERNFAQGVEQALTWLTGTGAFALPDAKR